MAEKSSKKLAKPSRGSAKSTKELNTATTEKVSEEEVKVEDVILEEEVVIDDNADEDVVVEHATDEVIIEDEEDTIEDDDIDEVVIDEEPLVDIIIDTEEITPKSRQEKNVKICLTKSHSCSIGGVNWYFEAGKMYTVPANVRSILLREELLKPF